jgi:hypothetical protein
MGSFAWRSCASGRGIPEGQACVLLLPNNDTVKGIYADYGDIEFKDGRKLDIYGLAGVDYDLEKYWALSNEQKPGADYDFQTPHRDARSLGIEREDPNNGYVRGAGIKLMRAGEYKSGMKYVDFPCSFSCREQGWVSKSSKDVDPRFELDFKEYKERQMLNAVPFERTLPNSLLPADKAFIDRWDRIAKYIVAAFKHAKNPMTLEEFSDNYAPQIAIDNFKMLDHNLSWHHHENALNSLALEGKLKRIMRPNPLPDMFTVGDNV